MELKILRQPFSVCRVEDLTDIGGEYFFTARTPEENSLICPTASVPANTTAREDHWRGFFIAGALDFSLIGVLAKISTVLAQEKIGIVAVSTYNTDYVFVKENNFSRALSALEKSGYTVWD
ncbi:MAG: ACT domain-containing protein [Clostridia bacterium]|nr:ACT domain-containing protein [Clostridia bacterium]